MIDSNMKPFKRKSYKPEVIVNLLRDGKRMKLNKMCRHR